MAQHHHMLLEESMYRRACVSTLSGLQFEVACLKLNSVCIKRFCMYSMEFLNTHLAYQ